MSAQLLRRPAGELKTLAESGAADLGPEASAAEVIGWVAEHFDVGQAAVASSMANAVLPHLVARQLPGVDVLFLDTGYHFAETLGTRADVARRLNVNVVDLQPEQSVAEQDAAHGKDLFATNPSLCCQLRKVEPLARALAAYEVWFTGIRRDEGPTRTNAPLISWDERHGLVKVNPLAAWNFDELLEYAGIHDVPVNMLLANGYPSIGCWPCTRPVADGEDPRAGRWAGLSKTECGIHT
ncbi:phosphoadenylyl-sulfate reductase [Arthrobacter pigmenti]